MKNSIIIIKLVLILSILTILIIFPIGDAQSIKLTLLSSIISLILGVVLIELQKSFSLFSQLNYEKPKWSDKLNIKNPLTYFHLIAYFFMAAGLGGIIGGLFMGQIFNFIGLILLTFGIGQIIGVYLVNYHK
jgi:hypothetical protein